MEKVIERRQEVIGFLLVDKSSGDDYGSGYGDGSGSGDGSGDGYGDGSGDGYGYGDGYGSGDGDGSGDGYGYGDGDGYGYGSGDGDGSGDGYGYGDGDGYGSGDGDGYGSGSGYGDGYGSDILSFNGSPVHVIDGMQTLIDSVHGNYARGKILNSDLTTTPCYVAKCGKYFAHGDTLKNALDDATEKYRQNLPLSERIRQFNTVYPDREKPIPARELFSWHHILTGSCLMGRKQFCKEHGIDLNKSYTVNFFISLTRNAYGSEAIRQLELSRPCVCFTNKTTKQQ